MRTFSLIFILLCSGTLLGAQDMASNMPDTLTGQDCESYVIILQHRTKFEDIYIAIGKTMTLWSEGTKVRGKITCITADSIYIDSLAFAPKAIDKVRLTLPNRAVGGSLLIVGGLAATGGGALMIALSIALIEETQDAILAVFTVLIGAFGAIIGAAIAAGGVGLITTGIIAIVRGKTFDLHKRWVLTIVSQPASPP